MGLDQYLFEEKKYNDGSKELEEIFYWRKANYIQEFFDNITGGVINCETHEINIDDLKHLKYLCEKVLKNHNLAEDYLPTVGGFFFGSTDYDDWYFDSIKDTKNGISKIIDEYKGEKLFYHAWW